MQKTVILSLAENKSRFGNLCDEIECGDVLLVSVKNSVRKIRKAVKKQGSACTIISHRDSNAPIFSKRKKQITEFSYYTVFPVLETICRQTAVKYGINIPFGEIYIVGSPMISCEIISHIYPLSKIFTIVSCESPVLNKYDELYFKYGTIIRHLPEFNNHLTDESIIINLCDEQLPAWTDIPIIDIAGVVSVCDRVVNPWKVYVSDEHIAPQGEMWGGKTGLYFYEAIGEIPDKKTMVDINKTADEIFLLDIDKF